MGIVNIDVSDKKTIQRYLRGGDGDMVSAGGAEEAIERSSDLEKIVENRTHR